MKHLVLLLTTIFVSFSSYAQLLIAPTRLVLNADQSVTEKIIVENNSDKPIRLEIKPVYRPILSPYHFEGCHPHR
jgi:P pilus assembly chaperone PapD